MNTGIYQAEARAPTAKFITICVNGDGNQAIATATAATTRTMTLFSFDAFSSLAFGIKQSTMKSFER
ncbi:hypothetical protein SDC9_137227 [bioreactor metagenome]|uniref:Uncharacterized protein n=1 Tax=bioreactor metagenome TaxID=1076179 RepID=A0A645DKY9_9ZZZZ